MDGGFSLPGGPSGCINIGFGIRRYGFQVGRIGL